MYPSMCSSADENFLSLDVDNEGSVFELGLNFQLFDEVAHNFAYLLRLVLLDDMTTVVYDSHSKLALHLCNRKCLVHAVSASK